MALSRIGSSLLRHCFNLVRDCECCCTALGVDCSGDPPTITVFGETFELDTFDAPTVNEAPFWFASGELVSGKVKLFNGAMPRYYGYCEAGESNLITPILNDDTACSFRYLMRDGFASINMIAVEYEDETLETAVNTSPLSVRADGTHWTGTEFSPRYTKVGGHTWEVVAAVNNNPYSVPGDVYLPEGSTVWEFNDGAEVECLP
jgi:hypothetical protein